LRRNQEAQRRLEEIVAERGKELAEEQGRKLAPRHQGFEHLSPAVSLPHAWLRRPVAHSLDGTAAIRDPAAASNHIREYIQTFSVH
jgi:hypothetical protein